LTSNSIFLPSHWNDDLINRILFDNFNNTIFDVYSIVVYFSGYDIIKSSLPKNQMYMVLKKSVNKNE